MTTSSMPQQPPASRARWQTLAVVLGVFVVLVNLVRWGGVANGGPLFVLGVAAQFAVMAGFAFSLWYLLLSPLKTRVEPQVNPAMRVLFGTLAVGAGLAFSVGTLWDEVWHRLVGGFGNDFLWPPHLLLYGSMATMAFFAVFGIGRLVLTGKGDLRARFRREPLVGTLALVCSYVVVNAPVDELWHRIYGVDITAWSLPHLSLFNGLAITLLVAIPLLLTLVPRTAWRGLEGLRWQEVLAVVMGGCALSLFSQLGTSEWENLSPSVLSSPTYVAFVARPEWLYPVVLTSIAAFIGCTVAFAVRRVGIATLVGVTCVLIRAVGIYPFGGAGVHMGFFSQLMFLPLLVLLDAYFALRVRRNLEPTWSWLPMLAVCGAYLAVLIPAVASFMVYPRVNMETLPGMVLWGLVMGLASTWAGMAFGGWLGRLGREVEAVSSPVVERRAWQVAAATLGVTLALVTFAAVTARLPGTATRDGYTAPVLATLESARPGA
jgi:hypothetical protein